jgi:hypothetical protein
MDGRLSGGGIYAELLADTVIQEVEERRGKLAKKKERQSPGTSGAFRFFRQKYEENTQLSLTEPIGFSIVTLTRRDAAATFAAIA